MFTLARRGRNAVNVWPAFVDALASILLVLVFMLLIFVFGQYLLSARLSGSDRALDELGRQVNALADTLALERSNAQALRMRLAATLAQLESQANEAAAARERAASASERALSADEQAAAARARATAADESLVLLNQQVAALRLQLEQLNNALDASEAKATKQQAEISRLGERLNLALAKKAEELQRYRSEFFGRLRALLGEHPSIRIVGDRFVFQSELLFPSGEATIVPEGQKSLAQLADTLKQVTKDIPKDIDWVLRIDGHTDRRPIATARFPSNWELSTARALSVVRFLAERGIPPRRLAAAGYGEWQPVDTGESEAALARNRRIEIKLTPP